MTNFEHIPDHNLDDEYSETEELCDCGNPTDMGDGYCENCGWENQADMDRDDRD
jgi:hypothetical protein